MTAAMPLAAGLRPPRDPLTLHDAGRVAAAAAAALVAELETWPKPGLVSHVDNGSHSDMTAASFRSSIDAIEPFLAELTVAGAAGADMDRLRAIGIEAERAMLDATGGANTHRGAIFGLGLLCAAAGAGWDDAAYGVPRQRAGLLCGIVRERWGRAILRGPIPLRSHGADVLRQYGAGGARAQAAAGFPHARDVGLPALRSGRVRAPGDAEAARIQAFFALMASVADTNLLHRGGIDGLDYARQAATGFLASGGVAQPDWRKAAERIHRAFVDRRLSPGGCADLLAVTLFLDALEIQS